LLLRLLQAQLGALLEDEGEDDKPLPRRPEEKGGCSHIASVLELLAQIQENGHDFDYVSRKAKGPRLDTHLPHLPLAEAWAQLVEARRRVYVGKTPLDDLQPLPTCVCRQRADHYSAGITVTCSICRELYHNSCIGLSKTAAGKLENDWQCGFCVGAGLDAESDINGADAPMDASGAGDEAAALAQDVEQTWTIHKVPRKVKGQPKVTEAVGTEYHRFFSETPAHFQRKKKGRVAEARGYASWDDLAAAIKQRSQDAMQYMTRLKAAGTKALKHGSHHVADTQGADGLQPVQVTAEVLDQLEDAGLLDVEDGVE
jgi:hypothetical protein